METKREKIIRELAKALHRKLDSLDPCRDCWAGQWDDLAKEDREDFETSVEFLLMHKAEILDYYDSCGSLPANQISFGPDPEALELLLNGWIKPGEGVHRCPVSGLWLKHLTNDGSNPTGSV